MTINYDSNNFDAANLTSVFAKTAKKGFAIVIKSQINNHISAIVVKDGLLSDIKRYGTTNGANISSKIVSITDRVQFASIPSNKYYEQKVDYFGLYPSYEGIKAYGGCFSYYIFYG